MDVSFDLYFVPRPTDGRWDSVMDELELAANDERGLTAEELDQWDRIAGAVLDVVPDAEPFEGDRYRQLDDGVGMQLTMYPGELSVTTPYWFEGDDADRVVEKLRRVASAIESVTDLVAYDPQAEAAFLDEGSGADSATFDQVATSMREQLGVRGDQQPPPRRRWAFWRR